MQTEQSVSSRFVRPEPNALALDTGERDTVERILIHVGQIAGLSHDIGKATPGHQAKIRPRDTPKSDAIRHELVSVAILLRLIGVPGENRRPDRAEIDEPGWIEPLTDAATIRSRLDAIAASGQAFPAEWVHNSGKPRTLGFLQPNAERPVLQALIWLIASHHRLPHGKASRHGTGVEPSSAAHVSAGMDDEPFLRIDNRPGFWSATDTRGGDRDWADALADACTGLADVMRKGPSCAAIGDLIEAHGRPALAMANQIVSRRKTASGHFRHCSAMLANAARDDRNRPRVGQPLHKHLIDVGDLTAHFVRLSLRDDALPGIDATEMPAAMAKPVDPPTVPPAFRWQDEARAAIQAREHDGIREAGGFYLVMADAGAGKTRGIPAILAALSNGGLRYSLGLGHRTLTLQSGEAYQYETGFRPDQVAVFETPGIGHENHDTGHEDGAESRDDYYEELAALTGSGAPTQNETELAWMDDERLRGVIEPPITISTIDQMLEPITDDRARGNSINLRLSTADLVLDDVDEYEPRDLVHIAKLIHRAGVCGRKVVLSSATLPAAIAEHLYAAYRSGWSVYRERTGRHTPVFAGWFGHKPVIERNPADFPALHRGVLDAIHGHRESAPVHRRPELLPLPAMDAEPDDPAPMFAPVARQVRTLHARPANHVTVGNQRVSIGLVRWSDPRLCRDFARYMAGHASPGADIRLVCYHEHHMPAMRLRIEEVLSDLLHRRHDIDERLEAGETTPGITALREALADTDERDVMIVVSATSVASAGHDHDYDWAIGEPDEVRGIMKTAGRVRRHRAPLTETDEANIAIMQRNAYTAAQARGASTERPESNHTATDQQSPDGSTRRVTAVDHSPSPFGALPLLANTPHAALSERADERLRWHLGERTDAPALDGLHGYLSHPMARRTNYHVRAAPFAGGPSEKLVFLLPRRGHMEREHWNWHVLNPADPDGGPRLQAAQVIRETDPGEPRCWLIRDSMLEIVDGLSARLPALATHGTGEMTSIAIDLDSGESANAVRMQFHPQLGAVRGSSGSRTPATSPE